jgi:tetratricopeptide (TPR) repeat protein
VALAQRGCDAASAALQPDPLTLWTTSFCEGMLFRRYPEAVDLIELAHVLDPRASHILTWGSLFLSYNQEFVMGMAYAHRSIACSPRDPMAVTQGFAGALAAVHAQEFEAALRFCERVLERAPRMPNVLRIKAAACQRLGRQDEARAAIAAVRALDPNETIEVVAQVNPLREWDGFQLFLDALRAAGLPERV